jgi:hypothetical protein
VNQTSAEFVVNIIKNPDSQLHTLILDKYRLGIPSTILIFQALSLSSVRNFSADGNLLTDDACHAFAKCPEQNPRLEFANLRRCDLPADGCLPIAASLPSCATYGSFGSTTTPSLTAAPNDSRPISQTVPWRVYRSLTTRSGRVARP